MKTSLINRQSVLVFAAFQLCLLTSQGQPLPVAENFKILGHAVLPGPSTHGDVAFFDHKGRVGKFAYVGTWVTECSGLGVKIIDVNNPREPQLVAIAGTRPGTAHDDPVVRRIPHSGRKGDLDLLAVGVQPCGPDGVSGLELFDVTDPAHPVALSFLPTPSGIHELDVVVRPDGKVLALLACPFAEFAGSGDFRIVDVTDPTHPAPLADWSIIANSSLPIADGNDEITDPFQGLGYNAAYFAQFARAADRGMTAYVAYFDGGLLKFDLTDPARPRLIGRTSYPFGAEGNAIYGATYEFRGNRYLLQSDEDIDSTGMNDLNLSPVTVTTSVTGVARFAGLEEFWLPTLLSQTGPVAGSIHDANDGCEADDFVGAAGRIVLIDALDPFFFPIPDGCSTPDKVLRAARAGAKAVLLNLVGIDDAWPFTPYFAPPTDETAAALDAEAIGMPVVQVSDIDELAAAIRAGLDHGEVTATFSPGTPSTGFLRVFSEAEAHDADGDGIVEYGQVGAFSDLPHVTGELQPPRGWWGIHGTEVNGDRAYAGWFSHGVIALDLSDPTRPRKVGQFSPPGDSASVFPFFSGPVVWGVAVDRETGVLYVSDMGTGLWIVKPTGRAAPSE